ncbi:hypothetical protein GCM10009848_14050 [Micromonospora lupini]
MVGNAVYDALKARLRWTGVRRGDFDVQLTLEEAVTLAKIAARAASPVLGRPPYREPKAAPTVIGASEPDRDGAWRFIVHDGTTEFAVILPKGFPLSGEAEVNHPTLQDREPRFPAPSPYRKIE